MRIRMISSRGGGLRTAPRVRALAALHLLVTFFAFAGAGPATAQGTYYADLNAAVTDLTSRLVENDRLAGKRVLVNAHDFFEEGTRRNLPLSATLRERFGTELSTRRGVAVFALPQGSEDDMVILQGVWRDVSEPGADAGTRTVHLTVKLVERTLEGHRVLSSEDGRVERIDARLLTPDLASWGRHVVRKLEDQARQRRRRIVHIGEVFMDGVPEPDRTRRYLVRRWLIPAFAQSRLFGLATGGGEQSEGTLQVDVFMDTEQVEIVLDVRDGAGGPLGAATVDMAKGVFPARYFLSRAEVERLLRECEEHGQGERWAKAWRCYGEVLERERGNRDALAGRERIEARYVERAKGAILRGELDEARGHVERLGELSPGHPRVPELEGEIARAERKAEERRIAELTPGVVDIEAGCFQMGSPESEEGRDDDERQHEVCVKAFSIGKHEVTRGEYARFVRETGRAVGDVCWTIVSGEWKGLLGGSWRSPGYRQENTHPVVCVSHEEAQAYAQWLSGETGRRYRLPTEAEWEYAARAGTQTSRHWGDDPTRACEYANVADETAKEADPEKTIHACRDGYVHTAPVGSFEANGYGLHDMLGNVWEWTCSELDEDYGGAERRCASGSDGVRVHRGGSWYSEPGWVHSASRFGFGTVVRSDYLGFRLAQD